MQSGGRGFDCRLGLVDCVCCDLRGFGDGKLLLCDWQAKFPRGINIKLVPLARQPTSVQIASVDPDRRRSGEWSDEVKGVDEVSNRSLDTVSAKMAPVWTFSRMVHLACNQPRKLYNEYPFQSKRELTNQTKQSTTRNKGYSQ